MYQFRLRHSFYGQALLVARGYPTKVLNFGQMADAFFNLVGSMGRRFQRVDVTFDWYNEISIKAGTRDRRL